MKKVDFFWKAISTVLVFALVVLMIPQTTGCASNYEEKTTTNGLVEKETPIENKTDADVPTIRLTKNSLGQNEFIITGMKNSLSGYEYIANIVNTSVENADTIEFYVQDDSKLDFPVGRYHIRMQFHKHWVYGCIKKDIHHVNIGVNDRFSGEEIVNLHITGWRDGQDNILGIYNTGRNKYCEKIPLTYQGVRDAIFKILSSERLPYTAILTISSIIAISAIIYFGAMLIAPVGIVFANDTSSPEDSQEPIEYVDNIEYNYSPVAQTTLFNYYSMNDLDFPSLSTRSQFYELLGLGSAGEYYGTAEQNTLLLNALKEKGICPTTVEELKEAIGFVEPLPTKEDASFKQDPGRASDPEMPEFVDLGFKKQGEEFRIKLFVFNPSDTNLVWLPNSGYGVWNDMKQDGFNEVPDFIPVDYTTPPNNAWTIEIVAKIPSNPGKKTLTFRMSFKVDGRQFGSYLNYIVNILGLATDVGKNAPNQSEWQQLYYASGGEKEVGLPYDDCGGVLVHRVGSALFQDFAMGKAGKGAFIRGDGVKAVHWVHGSIWEKYTSIASPIEKYGAPMTEEYSFNGKIRQDFERASFYFDKTNNQLTVIEYSGNNTQSTNPPDYHCKWSSQTPANPVTIKAGSSATLRLRLLNLGPATWYSGTVNLGTDRPQDRIPFYPRGTGWRQTGDANRILLFEPTVKPGEIGTFYFTISIPKTTKPGTYREYFRPVADNITWMEDYGIYWDIKVVK